MSGRPLWVWPFGVAWCLRTAVDYGTRASVGWEWRVVLVVVGLGVAAWCGREWVRSTSVERIVVALDEGTWAWTPRDEAPQ